MSYILQANSPKLLREKLNDFLKIYQNLIQNRKFCQVEEFLITFCESQEHYAMFLKSVQIWPLLSFNKPKIGLSSSEIFKLISNISFDKLIDLDLQNNSIYSIEDISFISFPNLKNLKLENNHVRSLQSFRKCKMENLEKLNLFTNYFNHDQLQNITRFYRKYEKQFKSLFLFWTKKSSYDDSQNQKAILTDVVKIQCKKIQYIITQKKFLVTQTESNLEMIFCKRFTQNERMKEKNKSLLLLI